MNFYIKHNLVRFANIIRNSDNYNIQEMLFTIYKLLCYFLGKPTKKFNWNYYTKDNKHKSEYDITPLDFFNKFCDFKFSDYVICSNIPIKKYPFYKKYNVKYCNNMCDGVGTNFFNIPISLMNKLCKASIDINEPIWFGSDVGKYLDTNMGIGDSLLYNYDSLYPDNNDEMSKGDKVMYGHSEASHAMLIIGYNKDKENNVDKWLVENSWGSSQDRGDGYIRINNEWFNKYTYLTAIPKKLFSEKGLKYLNKEPIELKPWSEFPCAALN